MDPINIPLHKFLQPGLQIHTRLLFANFILEWVNPRSLFSGNSCTFPFSFLFNNLSKILKSPSTFTNEVFPILKLSKVLLNLSFFLHSHYFFQLYPMQPCNLHNIINVCKISPYKNTSMPSNAIFFPFHYIFLVNSKYNKFGFPHGPTTYSEKSQPRE